MTNYQIFLLVAPVILLFLAIIALIHLLSSRDRFTLQLTGMGLSLNVTTQPKRLTEGDQGE